MKHFVERQWYCNKIVRLTPGDRSVRGGAGSGRFKRDGYVIAWNPSSFEEIVGYGGDGSECITIERSYCEVGWAKSGRDDIS